MEEYTTWCDEESNEKEDAITSSKRTIDDLSATMEDAGSGDGVEQGTRSRSIRGVRLPMLKLTSLGEK